MFYTSQYISEKMTAQEKDLRELEEQVSKGLKNAHKKYQGTPIVISDKGK